MERVAGTGYLARIEANKVGVRAGPNVVYIRLFRDFAEEGQQTTMFAELSPGDALAVIRQLQASVKIALATTTPV